MCEDPPFACPDAVEAAIVDAVDLESFPLAAPQSVGYRALVSRCRGQFREQGLFDLVGLLRPRAVAESLETALPLSAFRLSTGAPLPINNTVTSGRPEATKL